MADHLLTQDERERLREFAGQRSPRMLGAGAAAADLLRQRYPALGDDEMAAVIMQITGWAVRTGLGSGFAAVSRPSVTCSAPSPSTWPTSRSTRQTPS